jgi:hypothetical protein
MPGELLGCEDGPVWVAPCREKPRRQIHVKYNNWELEGEGGAWFDLEHTDAPHEQGADWWCAQPD